MTWKTHNYSLQYVVPVMELAEKRGGIMIPATLEQLNAMTASHPFVVQVCAGGWVITGSRHETETLAMFAATRAERHLGRETKSGDLVDSIIVREMRGGEWVTVQETEY